MWRIYGAVLAAMTALPVFGVWQTGGAYPAQEARWERQLEVIKAQLSGDAGLPVGAVAFRLRSSDGTRLEPEQRRDGEAVYPNGLLVRHGFEERGPALLWRMNFTNRSDRELHFEPALVMPVAAASPDYYDGYRLTRWERTPLRRNVLMNTYPVAAVIDGGQGFAFGTAPGIATSYLENGIDDNGSAYYLTRVALPPGQSCELEFVLFPFAGEHGLFDAMAVYQESFPEAFRPAPGVDPRLTGGKVTNGHYETNRFGGLNTPPKVRYAQQGYVGLCWAYAFYRRQGDYYGRPEYWKFDPPLSSPEEASIANKAKTELNVLDREAMHRDRIEVFRANDLRGNTASAFYVITTVDAGIIRDEKMEPYVYAMVRGQPPYQGWALGYGVSGHLYGWASPYEDILERDIPALFRETGMSAIAYDGFADLDAVNPIGLNEVYRGELREYLPGWSYDEEGRFIRMSIGMQQHADFFHRQRLDGKTLGLWANLWWTNTLLAFKPDAYLYENFDQNSLSGQYYDMLRRGLYFRGHRPAYIHNVEFESWISRSIPWQELDGETLRLAFEDCIREVITTLYQTNLVPVWEMVLTQKDIFDEMPYLTELSERGFYAPCPSQGDPALERVRYGRGLNSLLVLSNKERTTKPITERIDNRYLGDFLTLPVSYRQEKELSIHFADGKSVFAAALAPQENLLVALPAAIVTADPGALQVKSRMLHDAARKLYTYDFEAASPVEIRLELLDDPHFRLESVTWNGEAREPDAPFRLPAGHSRLEITAQSWLFDAPVAELSEFPWERASIRLPANAGERERGTAQMLHDYLAGTFGNTEARILEPEQTHSGPEIVFAVSEEDRIVLPMPERLEISGSDPFALQQHVWQLLRLQDRSNPRAKVAFGPIMEPAAMRDRMADGNQVPFAVRDTERRVNWSSLVRGTGRSTLAFGYENQVTVPVAAEAPRLTGDLGDPVWRQGVRIDDFRILGSQVPAQCRTEAWLLRHGDDLFVAFLCHEPEAARLQANHTRPDGPLWENDDVEVRLAPGIARDDYSRYPFYTFLANPAGTQTDMLFYPREMAADKAQIVVGPDWESRDYGAAWNTDWEVKTARRADGWTAEMRIPLRQLAGELPQQWRILLARGDKPHGEYSCWPIVPEGLFDNGIYFGSMTLEGADGSE